MTREEAVCLHRRCWTDMQKELGDSPTLGERIAFRDRWNKKMFPGKKLERGTILCDYTVSAGKDCRSCPINWGPDGKRGNSCFKLEASGVDYQFSPISEILGLPEMEEKEEKE